MSVLCHFRRCQRRKLRHLIKVLFTLSSLILLLWIYRSEGTFQFWAWYYLPATELPTVEPTVLQQCRPGRIVHQDQKVAVNKTKTVLISAYQEHRTRRRQVRVIAVVLRSERVAYRCLLCCQRQLHISEGVSYIHFDHFGFAYGTADIMCPVPSDCENPSHIAVTYAADESEDKVERDFLEVKNQKAKNYSFPYNFTVCISTMFEFTNTLQLVQSLEMLQLLGVNRVVIYRTSNSPQTQRILDYYTNKGLVEVIPWSLSRFLTVSRSWLPKLSPGDLHYFGQLPALNDCLYRYMYQSRYVALHDIDELILPQSVNSWLELLPLLERVYGSDQCYMFENNVFPNTINLPPPASQTPPPQTLWHKVPGVNILAHLYQEPHIDHTHLANFKVIVNPRAVFTTSVHGVLDSQNGCTWVQRSIARMYHTRAPLHPELAPDQLIYDGRLLSYCEYLTAVVNTVLTDTELLPKDSIQ